MDLQRHASDEIPEWEKYAPEDQNPYQRFAARTGGWGTRAMAATLGGTAASVASVVAFHNDMPAVGTALLVVEGVADLADGKLAELDKVRSPLGEVVDAGTDKPRLLAQLYATHKIAAVPTAAAVAIAATEVAIAVPSAIAIRNGNKPEVSSPGKIKMLLLRAAVGGFALAKTADFVAGKLKPELQPTLRTGARLLRGASWALTGGGVVFGGLAAKQSIDAARLPKKPKIEKTSA